MSRKNARGFTLLELVIAMGVLGILAGGVLTAVAGYTRRAQVSRAVQEIDVLSKAAAQWPTITGQPGYGGLTDGALYDRGLIPCQLSGDRCGGVNPWGGPYYARNWDTETYAIYVDGVPSWAIDSIRNTFTRRADCCWEWCCTSGGYRVHVRFR